MYNLTEKILWRLGVGTPSCTLSLWCRTSPDAEDGHVTNEAFQGQNEVENGLEGGLCNCLEGGRRHRHLFFFCLGAQGKVRSVICASVSDPAEEVSEVEHERVRRNSETSEWCSRDMVLLQSSVIRWLV